MFTYLLDRDRQTDRQTDRGLENWTLPARMSTISNVCTSATSSKSSVSSARTRPKTALFSLSILSLAWLLAWNHGGGPEDRSLSACQRSRTSVRQLLQATCQGSGLRLLHDHWSQRQQLSWWVTHRKRLDGKGLFSYVHTIIMHLTGKGCGFVFSYIHTIRILLSPEFLSFDSFCWFKFCCCCQDGMGNYGPVGPAHENVGRLLSNVTVSEIRWLWII